jgi:hypothetical protein
MNPEIWGPPLWYQMHMKTFNYNPKTSNKKNIIQYFENIKKVLPCEKCKKHYENYLISRPIKFYLKSRDDLIHWLIDLHNEVNARTGKRILSYKEARSLYETETSSNFNLNLLLVLLVLILFYLKFILVNK